MTRLKLTAALLSAAACAIAFLGMLEGYMNGTSPDAPSPLLLVGLVLSLAFAGWTVAAPVLERRAIADAASDPLRLIEVMVRRTRRAKLVAALLMFVMGAGLVVVPMFLDGSVGERAFIAGLGVLALGLAAYFAWPVRQLMDPPNAPVLRAVRDEPQRIVWVYEYQLHVNGFPAHTIFVCRDDGARYELNLMDTPPDELLEALAALLPHAVFGYSPELNAAWKRDPTSLRRGPSAVSAATEPAWLLPRRGVGDVHVGARAGELAARLGRPVADDGFTDLEDGLKVQCFDGEVCTVYAYTGVIAGYEKGPVRGFETPARTPDGVALGATVDEVLRIRPSPIDDALNEHAPVPERELRYDGITFRFDAVTGAMALVLITDPDAPFNARMAAFDQLEEAVQARDFDAIEGLRDLVTQHSLVGPAVKLYDEAQTWEERAAAITAVQDVIDPVWAARMRHFLDAPIGGAHDSVHAAKTIAVAHLEGTFDNFGAYLNDVGRLAARVEALR